MNQTKFNEQQRAKTYKTVDKRQTTNTTNTTLFKKQTLRQS